MVLNIYERTSDQASILDIHKSTIKAETRVCIPAIVLSFNATTQTISAQPAIKEKILIDGNITNVQLPILTDIPIVIPQCGGFAITMPINVGDECLLVFADMCIDAWYSYSGIQPQMEIRRHDLSDAFAIIGIKSQPNVLPNYSTNSLQIRNRTGTQYIDVSNTAINLVGNVKVNGYAVQTIR